MDIFQKLRLIGSIATVMFAGVAVFIWLLFGEEGMKIAAMIIIPMVGICLLSLFIRDRKEIIAEMKREWREARGW